LKTIKRMLEHQIWANSRLLAAVRQSGGGSQELLRLFRHLAIAEQVWITRLNGGTTAHLKLWAEDMNLDEIEALLASNGQQYMEYLAGLTEEQLDGDSTYANQSGVEFRTPIRDILAHVALHGQYHRGQINRMLREAGGEPQPLDFILFARNH